MLLRWVIIQARMANFLLLQWPKIQRRMVTGQSQWVPVLRRQPIIQPLLVRIISQAQSIRFRAAAETLPRVKLRSRWERIQSQMAPEPRLLAVGLMPKEITHLLLAAVPQRT